MSKISSKKIQYTPAPGYLFIEPQDTPQGDVFVQVEALPQLGKVLAVGPATLWPNTDVVQESPCKVGNSIIHSAGGFENVVFDGKKYRLVKFSSVIMVK